MKYSAKFCRGSLIMEKADEIIIKYFEKDEELIDFAQEFSQEKKLVVNISELVNLEDNIEILMNAAAGRTNIEILASKFQDLEIIQSLELPFFFIEGVKDYDTLKEYSAAGVAEVYLIEDLGFDIPRAAAICHNTYNIKVRVFPNIAQGDGEDCFKRFFIRPDAMSMYEDFIDTIEFYGPVDKQNVLYDIYNDERWLGNLNEVILGLDQEINNQTILPVFDFARLGCKKRCAEGRCDVCGAIRSAGKAMKDKNLYLKKRKATHGYESDEEIMPNGSGQTDEHAAEIPE